MTLKCSILIALIFSLTGCSSSPSRSDQENYDELIKISRSDFVTKYFLENSYTASWDTVINLPKACFPSPLTLNKLQDLIYDARQSILKCNNVTNPESDCFKDLECKFISQDEIKKLREKQDKLKIENSKANLAKESETIKLSDAEKEKLLSEQKNLQKKFLNNGCSLLVNYNNIQSLGDNTYLLRFPCFSRNSQSGLCTNFDQSAYLNGNYGVAHAIFKTSQKPFLGGIIYFKKSTQVKNMMFKDGTKNPVFFFNEDKGCHDIYVDVMDIQKKLKN